VVIGTCKIVLTLPASRNLKDKRKVIRGLIARIHARFNVSVAEIADQDLWQKATLGVGLVTTDRRLAHSVLMDVARLVGTDAEAVLCDYEVEIL
jgi:uncharacterized protein YlxP (DUF503 family)